MNLFLSGAITLGYLLAGLAFARFWSLTRDRLFACFSVAFTLLTVQQILIAFVAPANDNKAYLFLIRLLAFLVILAAIADKNRAKA